MSMEPFDADRRINSMKRLLTPLLFLVLLLAACGDSTSEVGTGSSADEPTAGVDDGDNTVDAPADDEAPIPVEPDGGIGDGAEPLPDVEANEQVITDDAPVDPKVVSPTEVVINPADDSELWVRFIGGDPNCTAATVTVLTETPEQIGLELLVGITSDALARSCLAGEFNLRVDVALNESATGKQISWSQPSNDEPQLVTPDLSTADFVGMTAEDAHALADENLLVWRDVRIDDEAFMVTEDYNPGRVNFEIDDGRITTATLG